MRSLDRFGSAAAAYATFRPRYPAALFDRLFSLAGRFDTAWDCGTGSGQAAVALAARFASVIATDTSAGQLAAAERHERVYYVRAAAERAPLRTGSADLVTVAQALHWFDTARFFAEVRRVLATAGVIAVWSYDLPRVGPGIDEALRHYYSGVVGPYWAPERRLVEDAYRSIEFPFDEIDVEPFEVTAALTLDEFAGYASTWSATLAFAADRGTDPVTRLRALLLPHWDDNERHAVRWPVTVRAGRT